ncbi:MAG: ATP-binding cassette domain-containing protein [Thermoanaerobaculia bacterium]
MEEYKFDIEDLHKSFGEKKVLKGVELKVEKGLSVVIVGGSGVGKSVFLKTLIGLIKPDRGKILVEGVDIFSLKDRELNEFRKKFGMCFQEGALFDSMTVFENIAFPLMRHRVMPMERIKERVYECLEIVKLKGVENKFPSQLSGGMRRRVGFARAIALKPEILLFDEPTTGLDPVMTALIAETIKDLMVGDEVTAITITHDLQAASIIADKIAMLFDGKIIFYGSMDDFLKSDHPAVVQFRTSNPKGPWTEEEI